MSLLDVRDLTVSLRTGAGSAMIVDALSLTLEAGQCLGIVGESGSGKSTAALAIMGLLSDRLIDVDGTVKLDGEDLLGMSPRRLRTHQGNDIAMIFQDPASSLNPVQRIGDQILECLLTHRRMSRKQAAELAAEALKQVGMPDPAGMMQRYPHQLSGGQRQRVMIAMAIILKPKLLIADEPTTALDLTIQAQILKLLKDLARDLNMALLLITHDLGVVSEMADTVIVLYAGRAVERGNTGDVLADPRHPYTAGLLRAHPSIDERCDRLLPIPGMPPKLWQRPSGCAFRPRCAMAQDICAVAQPEPAFVDASDREVACFVAEHANDQRICA